MTTTGQAYHHLGALAKSGLVEVRNRQYRFKGSATRIYLTALLLAAELGGDAPART